MTDWDMPTPTKLMVAGDWHGNGNWAISALKTARLNGCDAVLQLGDYGYWPEQEPGFLKAVERYLSVVCKGQITLYWLDGNHENHDRLVPGAGTSCTRHLPRGHRWEWWGKTWMSVGGGVSVDKKWRTPGKDWFPDETLSPRQWEHCMRDGKVDVVVAHDTPAGVDIPGIHAQEKQGEVWSAYPADAISESWQHRDGLQAIAEQTRPSHWFCGHYHVRYNAQLVYSDGSECMVIGMDRDNSHLKLNTLTLMEDQLV